MSYAEVIRTDPEGWSEFIDKFVLRFSWTERYTREELIEYLETPGIRLPDDIRECLAWLDVVYRNNTREIMSYFSIPGKPVTQQEMAKFWFSLSIKERIEFKNGNLG